MSLLFTPNSLGYAAKWAVPHQRIVVLVLARINMAIFHLTAYRRIDEWNDALPPPNAVRIAGVTSLMLWIGFTV